MSFFVFREILYSVGGVFLFFCNESRAPYRTIAWVEAETYCFDESSDEKNFLCMRGVAIGTHDENTPWGKWFFECGRWCIVV